MAIAAFETNIGYVKASEIIAVDAYTTAPLGNARVPITGQWRVSVLTVAGTGEIVTAAPLNQHQAEEIRDAIIQQMGCFKLPF